MPTWNYIAVEVRGKPQAIDDAAWLRQQLDELTASQEVRRAHAWAVEDAPAPYVEAQLKGIFGIEIPIDRIEGKWKVSQNRPEADRLGVVEGLAAEGVTEMAAAVAKR